MDFGFSITITYFIIPLYVAVVCHEIAHIWVADKLGDNSARKEGRLSLNPVKHIDIFGTIILPVLFYIINAPFLLGYAKPVLIDESKLCHPNRDMMLIALAGPVANMILVIVAVLLLFLTETLPFIVSEWIYISLKITIFINIVIAVINIIPIPPLDGGKILISLIPEKITKPLLWLENFGIYIFIGLALLLSLGNILGLKLYFLWNIFLPFYSVVENLTASIAPTIS